MRKHAVTSHQWDYVIVGVVLEVGPVGLFVGRLHSTGDDTVGLQEMWPDAMSAASQGSDEVLFCERDLAVGG
jgi:hypothetical protein